MIAFLFPGQGEQTAGMLHALDELPGGAAVVAQASAVLRCDVLGADDATALRDTAAAQRALLVAGVASANALRAADVRPDAVAGHSVGAFAAAVTADAIAFADALRIVDVRGRAMAAAFPAGYGMGAVTGLDERDVTRIACDASSDRAPVYAANVNAPDQIAVAGALSAVDAVLAAASAAGARTARRLDVAVPSHSPLMVPIEARLRAAFDGVDVRAPAVPYVANTTGRLIRTADAVRRDLIESIARPVRWADGTRALYECGVRLFVQMRPGTVLADLAAVAFPGARTFAVATGGVSSTAVLAQRMRMRDE